MNCSLSEGVSEHLDVLYDEYDGFDVQQTTVGINPDEFAALGDRPNGAEIRVRIEGDEGVLALTDGNEYELPGGVVETDLRPETIVAVIEQQTGVQCAIDGLDRVSIVCLQCAVVDDELWTLSAIFSATALDGTPEEGVVWREAPLESMPAGSPN